MDFCANDDKGDAIELSILMHCVNNVKNYSTPISSSENIPPTSSSQISPCKSE